MSDQPFKSELDQSRVELKSLFEMSQILNSSLDVKRVLNNCLLTPMGRMMITRGLAFAVDEDGGYVIETVKGLPNDLLQQKLFFEYEFNHPVFIKNIKDNECKNKPFFLNNGLELIVPMLSTNRMVGAMCLGSKLIGNNYNPHEIEFLHSLSSIAATSIENALIFQRLQKVNWNLDKKNQELKTLFQIGKELNSTLDKDKIINILLLTIMGQMAANKIFIFLQHEGQFHLKVFKGVAKDDPILKQLQEKFQEELGIIDSSFFVNDLNKGSELYFLKKIGIQVVAPMRIQENTKGVLLLGQKMSKKPFDNDEVEFLSTLCNRVMISLENANLFEEALEKQRLEKELSIAREIQQRLLPSTFPQRDGFDIFGFNIPSLHVGGDYFGCIEVDQDHIVLAIGDVAGKGVGASLIMSNLHAGLRTLMESQVDISKVISKLNDLIYANTGFDKFVTFFYAEINTKDKIMTCVNAGHNPPYLFHCDGSFDTLEKGGLILGMMPNVEYETEQINLQKGDMLITFTDGVTEAKSVSEEMYEDDRLEALIAQSLQDNLSVQQFADRLIRDVELFSYGAPQADDITMLGMKVL